MDHRSSATVYAKALLWPLVPLAVDSHRSSIDLTSNWTEKVQLVIKEFTDLPQLAYSPLPVLPVSEVTSSLVEESAREPEGDGSPEVTVIKISQCKWFEADNEPRWLTYFSGIYHSLNFRIFDLPWYESLILHLGSFHYLVGEILHVVESCYLEVLTTYSRVNHFGGFYHLIGTCNRARYFRRCQQSK